MKVKTNVESIKKTEWYVPFHITCYCNDTCTFMDPEICPDGAYVRWWKNQTNGKIMIDTSTQNKQNVYHY